MCFSAKLCPHSSPLDHLRRTRPSSAAMTINHVVQEDAQKCLNHGTPGAMVAPMSRAALQTNLRGPAPHQNPHGAVRTQIGVQRRNSKRHSPGLLWWPSMPRKAALRKAAIFYPLWLRKEKRGRKKGRKRRRRGKGCERRAGVCHNLSHTPVSKTRFRHKNRPKIA